MEIRGIIIYLIELSFDLQSKRKRPSHPNGTASPAGELEKNEDDHAGPELQRTGRCVWCSYIQKCLSCVT